MDKIDRLIQIIRIIKEEGGMIAGSGGFTGSADSKGPVAGYDPVMGLTKRKKIIGLGKGSRKRWMQPKYK
jgi:hypothetical protein